MIAILIISLGFTVKSNSTSFEEKFCNGLNKDGIPCTKILLVDNMKGIIFYRNEDVLMNATLNDDFCLKEVGDSAINMKEFSQSSRSVYKREKLRYKILHFEYP